MANKKSDNIKRQDVDVMIKVSEIYRKFNEIDATWHYQNLGKLQDDLVNAGLDLSDAINFIHKMGFSCTSWEIIDMWKAYLQKKEMWHAADMGCSESPSGEW